MNMMHRVEPAAGIDSLAFEMISGCPNVLDRIADRAAPAHAFLRAAWFRAAEAERTLLAKAGGVPVAAFPITPAGPAQLGATALAGSYWPFRSPVMADGVSIAQLAAMLEEPKVRATLGPVWRMGPFYADDPAGAPILRAAAAAGWSVLTRRLGHTYLLDVARLQADGQWPRPSTLKRIRNYERQLGRMGELQVEQVSGAGWTRQVFEDLAHVEANSWVGSATDGSGAKFINGRHRGFWEAVAADPVLGEMLSALILRLGDQPVAFSFDLNVGALQYGIAGSFDARFARVKAGKIATYRNIEWALQRGISRMDWGAGDSGYKSEIGAVQGPQIVDCLFVRSPALAALLRRKWEGAAAAEGEEAGWLPIGRREALILGSLATAAAFGALAE